MKYLFLILSVSLCNNIQAGWSAVGLIRRLNKPITKMQADILQKTAHIQRELNAKQEVLDKAVNTGKQVPVCLREDIKQLQLKLQLLKHSK
jgi:hypothetical protein